MSQPQIITIDGPAGVGKSTIARRLAHSLGITYLDTGAMYRTLGLSLGAAAADMPEDELRRKVAAHDFDMLREEEGGDFLLYCNGNRIGDEVRTERAGRLASIVAQLPALREALQEAQRHLAARQSLVVEGRDMGTKVFPAATHKFFLDARPEVRAERRYLQLQEKGETADKATILADIIARDNSDRNRAVDPLKPAPDAVIVDTSDISLEGVLAKVLEIAKTPAQAPDDSSRLSHLDEEGNLHMVDVGDKTETRRIARAASTVLMAARTLDLLKENALPKGDVLAAAKVAGIMAAKRTWEFIPLCHPLNITKADVRFEIQDEPPAVHIVAEVHTFGRTGVEMEALMAAQVAAATIYDMAKAVQKDMIIDRTRLLFKSGGKSGEFHAEF